ncbi:MAG: hypothetical protein EA383_06475 [Spirochaetaceae bacterium]|nr:MAG: hypothetical protein EA383_06475 [Spirochaetaceae bacterium]
MNTKTFFSADRVVFLRSQNKRDAIETLVRTACESADIRNPRLVADLVLAREDEISTKVSEGVAIPHAKLPDSDRTVGCIGISAEGVPYDGGSVHVIVLMLWAHTTNLLVLSDLGRLLRRSDLYEALKRSRTAEQVLKVLSNPPTRVEKEPERNRTASSTFLHALRLAESIGLESVLLFPDAMGSVHFFKSEPGLQDARTSFRGRVLLLTNDPEAYTSDGIVDEIIDMPVKSVSEHNLTTTSLLFLLSRGILEKTERVLTVFGEPSSGALDTIRLTNLKREFGPLFRLPSGGVGGDIDDLVFARVLQLATELAQEGREGKPAGTIFVLGDYETVKGYCHQLLVNPFRGLEASDRNVLDPSLEETVKEFSRIDGAFLISGDGVIQSAGTYLRADVEVQDLPQGLGARHTAAAAITAVSASVSIAISESTKRISVFRQGRRVMSA